ncbi:hypothetical protein KW517_09510 [Vibrio fluvialis]|uniref:hypothetical protein n=1 Tax=Vibrio fluvialis TaxID=676 RepID=UPI00056F95EB|nr:hypothetical protein [Vibrio fluvialis]MBY8214248.1 hypothetical protein [Vibrio fluvialis]
MKVKLLTALIVLNSQLAFADDSETNAVARQIKSKTIKVLAKQNIDTNAYFGDCDRSFPLFFKQVVVIFTYLQHLRQLCSLDLRTPRQ